jgi:DNA primase
VIPAGFLHDLLSRVDIVDVVGRHVELKRGGANLMGLCPFHAEKSPSFSVSPAKQFYYCFGCGASGDAIRFLTEHTGMSFVDAVTDLAQTVGMQVPVLQADRFLQRAH